MGCKGRVGVEEVTKRDLKYPMQIRFYILLMMCLLFGCTNGQPIEQDSILKIEMHLSAFGVESDDFPSIDVNIDFINDTSRCHKWYYNPANKSSIYSLTQNEMNSILNLLKVSDLKQLKEKYSVKMTDQPNSKTVIYTGKTKFTIEDYGLEGEYPLRDLYKIVYNY